MNVTINGRFLSQRITGVQRAAREIVSAIDGLLGSGEIDRSRWTFTVLAPPGAQLDLPLRHVAVRCVGLMRGQAWEQLELPRSTADTLLLSLANTGPVLVRSQIVTIYDASVFAVPEAYSLTFRMWYRLLLPLLGRRAHEVLTTSKFSGKELFERVGIPSEKIHVVPLGADHILGVAADPFILPRFHIGARPFVLAVSSRSPHKNFEIILRAIEVLSNPEYDFVFAGGSNDGIFGSLAAVGVANVKEVGYVTDAELRALYEHAACFIYPSLYEGFGLPPLEAMTCGCPVIASRATSLPEVCADAALYFDPHDFRGLACCIQEVMTSRFLRTDLSQRGLARAKCFSWADTARQVVRLLDSTDSRK